jgi:hypothetical protein
MSGNRTLTRLSGIVSIVSLTVATENQYANAVLPEGILVKKSDGVIYRTDGTHAIRDLIPVADQVLTSVEKIALSNAFSTGSYVIAPGGVVVHGSNGKINDSSLNIVASGKIKSSYLSDFVSNGMIKYAVLPEDVKTSFIVVNTYRDLLNLSAEDRKKLIIVIDSSGDPTNSSSGNSIYYYHNGSWQNVIMVANASVTYESVQAVSGVMYDHPLHLKTDDSNIHALLDALVIGEVIPDEPDDPTPVDPDEPTPPVTTHDETPDYIGTGWVNFINGLNAALTAPVPDVYVEDANYSDYVTIESNELNLAQTEYTITNTTTNDIIVLPVTSIVANTTGIAVVEYDRDDPDIHELLYPSTGKTRVKNEILHLVISDGTLTFTKDITRNNCFDDLYCPGEISTDNGWSSDNIAGYLL